MKKKLLFIVPSLWLWGTEKTAQIYLTALKDDFDVYVCALNNSWPREQLFREQAKDIIICEWDFVKLEEFILNKKIDIVYLHWISGKKNSIALVSFLKQLKWQWIQIIETSPFSLHTPDTEQYLDYKLFVSKTSLLKFLWKFKQPKTTKYYYLYNPIDCIYLEQFRLNPEEKKELRKKYNLEDKFVIWKVGRADIWKRDDTIINIMPNLIKKIPNIVALVRSIPNSKLKKIKKLWIEKYFVVLSESVDEKEIANTYQLMDLMFHTSRIGESFWITLVEWMFFGLPIISNFTDWMQWTAYDRDNSQSEIIWKNNYILNKHKDMINKILEFKENRELYDKISKQNIERVYQNFDVKKLVEKLKSILINEGNTIKNIEFDREISNYKMNVIKESCFRRMYLSLKAIYEKLFY